MTRVRRSTTGFKSVGRNMTQQKLTDQHRQKGKRLDSLPFCLARQKATVRRSYCWGPPRGGACSVGIMSITPNNATDDDAPAQACNRCGYGGGILTYSVETPANRLCHRCARVMADD